MKLSSSARILLALLFSGSAVISAQRGPDRAVEALVTTLSLSSIPLGDVGGVSVDDAGVIYVADFDVRVYRITQDGDIRTLTDSFACSSGNTVAPNGNLLQSDFMRDTVSEVDVVTGEVTVRVLEGLSNPVGVISAPDGTLFVCNCGDDTIARVGPGESFATTYAAGPEFRCPNGIVMDPDGNLFVVNFYNGLILKIDPFGHVTPFTRFGRRGNAHLTFAGANHKELYFTNYIKNQVFRISPNGHVTLLAGSGQRALIDGYGTDAAFRRPNGIASDREGILFLNNTVSRPGEFRRIDIRRIDLP